MILRGKDGPAAMHPEGAVRMLLAAAPRIGGDVRGVFTVTPLLGIVLKSGTDPVSGDRMQVRVNAGEAIHLSNRVRGWMRVLLGSSVGGGSRTIRSNPGERINDRASDRVRYGYW